MKQGSGNSRPGSQKREPISHAGNVGGVSQIGAMVGRMAAVKPIESGRGFSAPAPKSCKIYPKGSQR